MIGLEKSFQLIYSNTHLRTSETNPLSSWFKRSIDPNCAAFLFMVAISPDCQNNGFFFLNLKWYSKFGCGTTLPAPAEFFKRPLMFLNIYYLFFKMESGILWLTSVFSWFLSCFGDFFDPLNKRVRCFIVAGKHPEAIVLCSRWEAGNSQ